MSASSNPFEELERLFEQMGRQLSETSRMWVGGSEPMAMDLVEEDDAFVARVDLPGFEREDIHLRVTDHRLHIEAERETTAEESDAHYLRHERSQESRHRSIRLPDEVDTESVTATMQNGVLTITLPKLVTEEGQEISID